MGLGMEPSWQGFYIASMKPESRDPQHTYNIKPNVITDNFNPSTWEVKAEESEPVQGTFESILS